MRLLTITSFLLFGLLDPGHAAPLLDGPPVATARKLANEGSKALASGDLTVAIQKLELSYSKAPIPEVLYQLGRVAQLQHRNLAAVDLYRRYLSAMEDSVNLQIKAEIEQFIVGISDPPTELKVLSGDSGALLRVDGRVVGVLPLATPLLVSAGEHRFQVERNRQTFETNALQIPPGQRVQLELTLAARYAVLTVAQGVALLITPQNASPAVQSQLAQAVLPSVQAAHGFLIGREQTEVALGRVSTEKRAPCASSLDCQEQLARTLEATQVLTLSVQPSLASPAQIALRLFDVGTGILAESADDTCDSCSPETIKERIAKLSQKVLQAAWNRGRGSIQITSDPPGALVVVAGRAMGKTPFSRDAFEGAVEVELSQEGFVPYRTKLDVTRGQQATLKATLQRPAAPPPIVSPTPLLQVAPPRRPVWRLVTGGVLTGSGLLLAGFGLSALAARGTCVMDPQTPSGICNSIRNTNVPTGVLLGSGGVFTIAGAVLLAWPPK